MSPQESSGPSEMARRIAREIEARYDYTGTVEEEVTELASLIDREIAKSGVVQVSREVLERVMGLAERIEAETEGIPEMSCEIAHGLAVELLSALGSIEGRFVAGEVK